MKKLCVSLLLVITMICSSLTGSYSNGAIKADAATDTTTATGTDTATVSGTDTITEQEFIPSSDYVKQIGRTNLLDDTLWCAYSGTGIEFTFTGTKAELNLIGDSIATNSGANGHYCRYGIYVNDKLIKDELLKQQQKTITAFESSTEQTVTIRIIKKTETADSLLGIGKIKVNAKGVIKPTEAKKHRIEFIGDSITCGFGVDDADRNSPYSTATEDFTKTYAYKTAQTLDADYSVAAISGYGIISGYTSDGNKNTIGLMPKYYDKLGFSYGTINNSVQVSDISWDFNKFVPDVIVINLGTNDSSYTGSDQKKMKAFEKGYVAFLKQVRKVNPNATILCTLGTMGSTLYPSIENAVKQYTKKTGDKKVSAMRFDNQLEADGICACWHPSEKTHAKSAKKLSAEIKKIMKW